MPSVLAVLILLLWTPCNATGSKWEDEFKDNPDTECINNATREDGSPQPARVFLYTNSSFLHGYTLNSTIPEDDTARKHECAVLCLSSVVCSGFQLSTDSERTCEIHHSVAKPDNVTSPNAMCIQRRKDGTAQTGANKLNGTCRHNGQEEPYALANPECRLYYSLINSADGDTTRQCYYKSGLPVPSIVNPLPVYWDTPILLTIDFGEPVSAGFATDDQQSFVTNGNLIDMRPVEGDNTLYEAEIMPDPPNGGERMTHLQLTVMQGIVKDAYGNPNPNTNLTMAYDSAAAPSMVTLSSPLSTWDSLPMQLNVTFEVPIDVTTFNISEDLTLSIEALYPAQQATAAVVHSNVVVQPSQVTLNLSPTVEGKVNVTIGSGHVADAVAPHRGNSPASIQINYSEPQQTNAYTESLVRTVFSTTAAPVVTTLTPPILSTVASEHDNFSQHGDPLENKNYTHFY
ncbi:unnamed protein product [Vitrella brassicaformis CCMP3155]|uniref:Apple domain-containing protein n=1 Tax=Vitrella brassicaformis (strain CCMP3155) TaxID=1169540 RepID=A0A0G4GZD5_VITBC|nr:unnamed protein product [Vitrella brassicaformis CCMP3155]|eukprot:CEM36348.1 unnamed protein product [Vitrella brassicaformis CCMP3155]